MAIYRKLYPRIWPQLAGMSDGERAMAFYVLAGTQTNRIGLFRFMVGAAADELRRPVAATRRHFSSVCRTFGWVYDDAARVVWIPSWWTWNEPENPNVLKGCLKDLDELPATFLTDQFAKNDETLPETLRQTFREVVTTRLNKRFPKRSRNQEQEQEQEQKQDQKQDPRTKSGAAGAAHPSGPVENSDGGGPSRVVDVLDEDLPADKPPAVTDLTTRQVEAIIRREQIELTGDDWVEDVERVKRKIPVGATYQAKTITAAIESMRFKRRAGVGRAP